MIQVGGGGSITQKSCVRFPFVAPPPLHLSSAFSYEMWFPLVPKSQAGPSENGGWRHEDYRVHRLRLRNSSGNRRPPFRRMPEHGASTPHGAAGAQTQNRTSDPASPRDSRRSEQRASRPDPVGGVRSRSGAEPFRIQSNPGPAGTMDEEMLILEVQNHRIIYDPSHPFYKDTHKKDAAWNSVAGVIGADVDPCKAKWRSLRDSFVKSRKKMFASGSSGGSQREWKYTDIMSFLLPHVHPRSSKISLSAAVAEEERSSTPVSTCGSDDQAPPTASAQRSVSPTLTGSAGQSVPGPTSSGERDRPHRSRSPREGGARTDPRRTHRPQQTSNVEDQPPSIRDEPNLKPDSDLDECYHFTMSLIPQLHRLDKKRRLQAKIGILNLLHNTESS
ncbi:transcription factor Adf-1-like [Echeneis naucrates]|uniref:transcription factor Adf-1-like n=1 Tax=Echeneis naucrates TaxID=173247 RepID=UPI0011143D07|nr:transcription factor Adf-1-like [Echeneis naucrates]